MSLINIIALPSYDIAHLPFDMVKQQYLSQISQSIKQLTESSAQLIKTATSVSNVNNQLGSK